MHCKDVAIHEVSCPLTRDNISGLMNTWKAYKRSEYLVLRNGTEMAVVRMEREGGKELFQRLKSYEIISLPEETIFHSDRSVDVLNPTALVKIQLMYPGKTVVICGMFSHVSFVKDMVPFDLRVVDNVPPSPSKLGELVRMALAGGYVDYPVITENIEINMADYIGNVKTEAVMFPCKVSDLKADIPFYFLDEAPELKHDVTLIGCNLSKRIYEGLYESEVPFITVCPADFIPNDGKKTIVKCCKVKEGHTRDGNTVMVPWGATVPEVVEAINDLFDSD